jgi:16S rRNA (cytidine1402-2'-O)-methyltransferase
MLGKLYIVATPIGNLQDISQRALRVLKEVDIILAEDTRVSSKLTAYYMLPATIVSYHQHSSDQKRFEILSKLLDGKNIALVSDAGTPGISDPGNELIDFILSKEPDIKTVPIPGPSAVIAALSISGFRANKFVFLGFLPKKGRTKLFAWLKQGIGSSGSQRGLVFAFYESPKRILKTLEVIGDHLDSKVRVCVARELTKMHETIYRGEINGVISKLKNDTLKGEIVVLVEAR